jgi:hypothetical protein
MVSLFSALFILLAINIALLRFSSMEIENPYKLNK